VFFFIASLLPFLLWNRVKVCLLVTYLFTYYLGFMTQWGDYIAANGSMQPFVIYALSGVLIAVIFVVTMFSETPEKPQTRWTRFRNPGDPRDPLENAVNVTQFSDPNSR
jgi:fatty acid desaturase